MPLPPGNDEPGLRSLDARCASRASSAAKNTVAQLTGLSLAHKEAYMTSSLVWNLSNFARCLLDAELDANVIVGKAADQRPVLVLASFMGLSRIVAVLLEAGADHRLKDAPGFTALYVAAEKGHSECVQLLLEAGADANVSTTSHVGNTPMIVSLIGNHLECVRLLLPATDLFLSNQQGLNALHFCVSVADDACLELLLPRVSDVDVRTVRGKLPNGEELLAFGETALHLACGQGQQQKARALLKRGANRMALDSLLRTPLQHAAIHGHLSCCVLLLGQPGRPKMTAAEVDAKDGMGLTALFVAAMSGYEKICGVLIQAGAQLDVTDKYGYTPLTSAQLMRPTNAALLAVLSGHGPARLPGTVCDHCSKTMEEASVSAFKACGDCHGARYCNAACSAAAWPGHKAACRARKAEREAARQTKCVDED